MTCNQAQKGGGNNLYLKCLFFSNTALFCTKTEKMYSYFLSTVKDQQQEIAIYCIMKPEKH